VTENLTTPLILPAGDFGAYLFDLDGTVADSMPLHLRSWQQAVAEFGGSFPEEMFYSLAGVPLPRTVELLNERFHTNMPVEATVHRKEQLYLELLPELEPIAEVLHHVHAQHGKIPLAIVSGSPRLSIHRTLTQLGIFHRFDLLIGAEDYTHGKPEPEPFLLAATRLHVAPERCLVFEDADAGIQAAAAAGMKWVRVPQSFVAQPQS
jgi:HAD superfamily hydrolase (TIGR01509 family)